MADQNRAHQRIDKPLTIQFCIADMSPKKWDMSIIQNISAGGVKFKAKGDLKLVDKIILLQIRVPELAPHMLQLEAIVLDTQNSFVRAKFINLSEISKEQLLIVEKMVNKKQ